MKIIIVIVLILALATLSHSQKAQPIPGAEDVFAFGFDRVTGSQSKNPIIQFHYDSDQKWAPSDNPTLKYSVPDEIFILNTGTSEELVAFSLVSDFQTFLRNYYASWGFQIFPGTAMFSKSYLTNKEVADAKAYLENGGCATGLSYHWYSLYQLGSMPANFLTPHSTFLDSVNKLPPKILTPEDQKAYDDIIRNFGTDLIYQGNFGIRIDMNTFFNETLLKNHSLQWIQTEIALTYHYVLFNISNGGFYNRSDIHIAQDFAGNSTYKLYFYGGNPKYQKNDTLKEWLESLEQYPHFLNLSVQPLSTLVPNKQVASSLLGVIQDYIRNGTLVSDRPGFKLSNSKSPKKQYQIRDMEYRNLRNHLHRKSPWRDDGIDAGIRRHDKFYRHRNF